MTNSQKRNSFWVATSKIISDYWIDVPTGLIPIALGLLGWLNNGIYSSIISDPRQREKIQAWTGPLILLFTVLSVIFFVLQLRRTTRLSTLKEENKFLKEAISAFDRVVYEHTDSFLSSFARDELKFGNSHGCDERITIYVHDPSGYFVPIGRHSENPKFKKRGRSKYPDNQGFIAKAWERDFYFDNNYPDPQRNYTEYIRRLASDSLPADVINKISMQSVLLFGCRIKDVKTHKPIALIILETTKSNRYKEKQLQAIFSQKKKEITSLIQRLEPVVPSISEPRGLGL